MGIFGRIRKFFSRSDSSSTSTDRFSHGARLLGHSNDVATESSHVVQRSYQVEHNRHFNVSTSSERSSNVIDSPQDNALHRSNTTSVTARASNASHRQPYANLERAISCKEFTLPLLRNAIYSAEYVKATNTSANVSQFPRRSTGSEESKVDSKISNEKNYGQKYPRPSHSSAEYITTGIGESGRKAPNLNILQSTQKPGHTKQTTNQNTLTSTRKVDNVNSSEFGRTTKPIIPSASISITSANREHRSTVEVHRNNTSKYTMPTTSEAKTAKENNTTRKPDLLIRMAAPSEPASVSMDYEPTIPQLTRTCINDVGKIVKAPGANLPKPQGISSGFHSVKGECIKSHFKTASTRINAHAHQN